MSGPRTSIRVKLRVLPVVEVDLERLERHGRGLGAREALCQPAVEPVARLVGAALAHEPQQLAQVGLELGLDPRGVGRGLSRGSTRNSSTMMRPEGAPAAGVGCTRRPLRVRAAAVAGRRGGRRRVDLARLDVERGGGEQPAQERELREEVEADDRDVEAALRGRASASRARAASCRARPPGSGAARSRRRNAGPRSRGPCAPRTRVWPRRLVHTPSASYRPAEGSARTAPVGRREGHAAPRTPRMSELVPEVLVRDLVVELDLRRA